MSVYCTPDAVRSAINPDWRSDVADPEADTQDASSLSDAQLADAIAQASGRVDSYIAARYQTPVAPVDPAAEPLTFPDQQIGYLTRDIAAYLASLTFFRSSPMEATEPVLLRYQAAMADLKAIAAGSATLNLPAAASGDALGGGYAGAVDTGDAGTFCAGDAGFHSPSMWQPFQDAPWVGWGGPRV